MIFSIQYRARHVIGSHRVQGRNRNIVNIFQGRQSHFSRCDFSFFPVEISILVDPKKLSVVSVKVTSKKKKGSSAFFSVLFPLTFFIFFLPFSIFSDFLLHFPFFTFFSLPHLSRLVGENFLVESLWGAQCPLPPPSRYATDRVAQFSWAVNSTVPHISN